MSTLAQIIENTASAVVPLVAVVSLSGLFAHAVRIIAQRIGEDHERAFYARYNQEPPDTNIEYIYTVFPPFVRAQSRTRPPSPDVS
jgi:hypothetical protein